MKKICALKGYEDSQENYYIATCGRVIRGEVGKWKFLKSFKNKKGYHQIAVYNNKGSEKIRSLPYNHKLVALAFLGNYDILKKQVDHLDMNKDNNYINNLEWVTNTENMDRSCALKGKFHQAKLTHEESNYIRKNYKSSGVQGDTRNSNVKELMKMFNVSQKTISNIGKGKSHIRKFG